MHEMSLCEGILGVIEEAAAREGFSRVCRVRLEVGRFSGAEPNALRFGFDVVMKGSLADGAMLEIIERPGLGHCFSCGETVEIASRIDPCPRCGGTRVVATGGEELRIKDLEVV
jgi:hydrogenase nickel incorporation protein HypA/HybF